MTSIFTIEGINCEGNPTYIEGQTEARSPLGIRKKEGEEEKGGKFFFFIHVGMQ